MLAPVVTKNPLAYTLEMNSTLRRLFGFASPLPLSQQAPETDKESMVLFQPNLSSGCVRPCPSQKTQPMGSKSRRDRQLPFRRGQSPQSPREGENRQQGSADSSRINWNFNGISQTYRQTDCTPRSPVWQGSLIVSSGSEDVGPALAGLSGGTGVP
jgi:hypothetical protein